MAARVRRCNRYVEAANACLLRCRCRRRQRYERRARAAKRCNAVKRLLLVRTTRDEVRIKIPVVVLGHGDRFGSERELRHHATRGDQYAAQQAWKCVHGG